MRIDGTVLEQNGWTVELDGQPIGDQAISIYPKDPDRKMMGQLMNAIDGHGLTIMEMERLAETFISEVQKVQLFKLID